MGVDDVEGAFGQALRGLPEVAGAERDVGRPVGGGVGRRLVHHGRREIDADDGAGRADPAGEVDGQGAGAAADVEEALPVGQVGQEVGGGVLGRPPAVGAQHGVGVAVDVGVAGGGHGRAIVAGAAGRNSDWHLALMPSSASMSIAPLPPVERVRPGLWSIPVPIPNNPLRYVLVYAFETDGGSTSSTPAGTPTTPSTRWPPGWPTAGASMADVRGVMVTHIHPDHYGLAGRVREASGAWVALHPADAALIPDRYDEPEELLDRGWPRPVAAVGSAARGGRGPDLRLDARPQVGVAGEARRPPGGRGQAGGPRLGPAGHLDAGALPRPPVLLGAPQPADADRRPRPAPDHAQHRAAPPVGRRPAGRLPPLAGEADALRQRRGAAGPRAPLRRPPGPADRAGRAPRAPLRRGPRRRSGPAGTPPGRWPAA